MPYLRVRIATADQHVSAQQIASMLTDLAVTKLGKNAGVAAVDVQFQDPKQWFIGGHALKPDQSSFFIEIKITSSTNSRDDKAAFVKAAYQQMAALLPNVQPTSYIVLQDVASDSWGYGGLTQEFRYIHG